MEETTWLAYVPAPPGTAVPAIDVFCGDAIVGIRRFLGRHPQTVEWWTFSSEDDLRCVLRTALLNLPDARPIRQRLHLACGCPGHRVRVSRIPTPIAVWRELRILRPDISGMTLARFQIDGIEA